MIKSKENPALEIVEERLQTYLNKLKYERPPEGTAAELRFAIEALEGVRDDIVRKQPSEQCVEHELKILPEFYARVCTGEKAFEIRKNDRDYQVGDILVLKEWRPGDGFIDYSVALRCEVTYLTAFEQKDGYVVMGIKLLQDKGMLP